MTDTIKLVPIADFDNAALRKSVEEALAAVPEDHFRAVLDIDNKGLGVMFVTRVSDEWAVVVGGRFNREDRQGAVRVVVQRSWK